MHRECTGTQLALGCSVHRGTVHRGCTEVNRSTAHPACTETHCTGAQHLHSIHMGIGCMGTQHTRSMHRDIGCTEMHYTQEHSVRRAAACKGSRCAQGCGMHRATAHTACTKDTACTGMWARSLGTFEPFSSFSQVQRRHGWLCILHGCWCGSGKVWVCKRFYFSSAGAAVAAGLEASSHPFSHLDTKHG